VTSESGNLTAWKYASGLADVVWPAIPAGDGTVSLGFLFQLESTQWLSPQRLFDRQLGQLDLLLRHAFATVPHYRQAWSGLYDPDAALTAERLLQLPRLSRAELQAGFESLKSASPPPAHGSISEVRSSGSTGTAVRVLTTRLSQLIWNALTLRDHLWHRRDLSGKLAAIRLGRTPGTSGNWGLATLGLLETGPSTVLSAREDVDSQLRWLEGEQPDYLMTYPSLARELARRSTDLRVHLPKLREVRTFGEMLVPETRDLCQEAWKVPVTDVYSAEEVGYIALQCPGYPHYHIQSESALVEIIDDRGRPCRPGQVGRVAVTPLHGFAMPLIRYELGDYAEVGDPCPCGRGLPVLRRIMGRVRNMLTTASGSRYWPALSDRKFAEIAPVLQRQVVQKDFDALEVRLVVGAPLTRDQEGRLRDLILSGLPADMRLDFVYCSGISRSAGGKFEDFISEVSGP
jgi:phenylacetate-CoA ligase